MCAIGRLFPAEVPLKSRAPAGAAAECATGTELFQFEPLSMEHTFDSPSNPFLQVLNLFVNHLTQVSRLWIADQTSCATIASHNSFDNHVIWNEHTDWASC
jgi:hypothetical protein